MDLRSSRGMAEICADFRALEADSLSPASIPVMAFSVRTLSDWARFESSGSSDFTLGVGSCANVMGYVKKIITITACLCVKVSRPCHARRKPHRAGSARGIL